MKRLVTILLALTLILSLNVATFAATQDGNPQSETSTMPANQQNTVNINKVYKLTNADTVSPAETVAFTWTKVGVENAADGITNANMPDLVSVVLAAYAQGAATTAGFESDLVVTLPVYTGVGVYTYTITETDGNMAGVTYGANTTPITLVVTVTQGADGLLEIAAIHAAGTGEGTQKTDTFENTYSAGNLVITKTVTGNMGDQSKYFDVTVTLVAPSGDTVGAPITISGGSDTGNPATVAAGWTGEKTVPLKIKHGETITLENLPYGVTYTVDEADYSSENYTTTGEVTTATEVDSASATVSIVNNKEVPIDTGISLDSLPYILLLVAVAAVVVVMIIRKRRAAED